MISLMQGLREYVVSNWVNGFEVWGRNEMEIQFGIQWKLGNSEFIQGEGVA